MSNNLTGAIVQPILTTIAKAIIRAEKYKNMSNDEIKSYLYKIQAMYQFVDHQDSDNFIKAIMETYFYLQKTAGLNIETMQINRSSYYMYKNNDELFSSNNDNPILDEELINELTLYSA